MKALIAGLVVAFAVPAQGATPKKEYKTFQIPPKYWGEYNEDASKCGTDLSDMRLRVSWNTVLFYESSATVTGLIQQRNGDLTVLAKFTGEGETWVDMFQMSLSTDRKILRIIHPKDRESDGAVAVRTKCN